MFVVSPTQIRDAVDQLGTPLVVRSSAVGEDGADVSFAGQFRSFLNLNTVEEVEEAVRLCHASLKQPSVIQYCRKNGVDPDSLRMEVIIQRMIEPELAGVAFTVNPITGEEEVLIEACAGLADGLLAGSKTGLPQQHPLMQKHRAEIETTARRIQRHFGAPQDIEFAIGSESLYVLQARPVTRIGFASDIGEWTNADFRDGGVSSTVCTPLMWSLYDFIWDRSLKGITPRAEVVQTRFSSRQNVFRPSLLESRCRQGVPRRASRLRRAGIRRRLKRADQLRGQGTRDPDHAPPCFSGDSNCTGCAAIPATPAESRRGDIGRVD